MAVVRKMQVFSRTVLREIQQFFISKHTKTAKTPRGPQSLCTSNKGLDDMEAQAGLDSQCSCAGKCYCCFSVVGLICLLSMAC